MLFYYLNQAGLSVWKQKKTNPVLFLAVVCRLRDSAVAFNRDTGKLQKHFKGDRLRKFSLHIFHWTCFVNLTTVPFKYSPLRQTVLPSAEKYTVKTPVSACTETNVEHQITITEFLKFISFNLSVTKCHMNVLSSQFS